MGEYFCINGIVRKENLLYHLIKFLYNISDATTFFDVQGYCINSGYDELTFKDLYDPVLTSFSDTHVSIEKLREIITQNVFSDITVHKSTWPSVVRLVLGVLEDNSVYVSLVFEDEVLRETSMKIRKEFILTLSTLLYNSIPMKYGNGGVESPALDNSSLEWPDEYYKDALYYTTIDNIFLNLDKSKFQVLELGFGVLYIDEQQM